MARRSRPRKIGGLPFDGSWPFLITFLFFSASFELFPRLSPGHSGTFYLFIGVLVCFLYLLAVLIHEGGHLLAGKIVSFPYEGDILSIWGGRPKTVRGLLASDPKVMVVRMAGPLANLLVGGAITFLVSGIGPVGGELVSFFARSNLLIAFVNMIPLLPFDMGVLLLLRFGMKKRDSLTGGEKDFSRGIILGWVLTVGGILLGGRGSFLAGFGFVILGFLLIKTCLSWRERLGFAAYLFQHGVTWAVTVTTPPLSGEQNLLEARELFGRSARPLLPVVGENGHLQGKMGWRELRRKPVEAWHLYPVVEMMEPLETDDVVSLDDRDVAERIFEFLEGSKLEVWVTSGNALVGEIRPARLYERFKMDRLYPVEVRKDPADQQTIEG